VLEDREIAALEAAVDTLIPPDDAPGAAQAGVLHYIDRQLGKKYRAQRPLYRQGLAALIAAGFPAWPATKRTEFMTALEAGQGGKTAFGPDGGKAFFEALLAHTMQGYFGMPRHGGNRDYAGWALLGVPAMQIRGRQHYNDPGSSA
jgi:gluconate 2-dehydrogenase gamma chain